MLFRSFDRNMGAFLRVVSVAALHPGVKSGIPQHVGHDKQPHVRAPNVDPVQMSNSAIALGDVDVLQLAVHVVLGCVRPSVFFTSLR